VDKNNFLWLLLALLVLLFGVPVADDFSVASALVVRALLFSCLLTIGVWSLRGTARAFTLGISLVIIGVVSNILAVSFPSQMLILASFVSLFAFLLLAIAHTLKQVALENVISVNRLVGAICVYLLLGVIWAVAYSVLDLLAPGSFEELSSVQGQAWDSEWLYFSFVTMTTLGYGDITPASATAKALAYMQAVFGQLYVAILVAGLVSAYISGRQSGGQNEN
jgi:voltage-gated potassium channel